MLSFMLQSSAISTPASLNFCAQLHGGAGRGAIGNLFLLGRFGLLLRSTRLDRGPRHASPRPPRRAYQGFAVAGHESGFAEPDLDIRPDDGFRTGYMLLKLRDGADPHAAKPRALAATCWLTARRPAIFHIASRIHNRSVSLHEAALPPPVEPIDR
jgi:hypothetical protein